jgi:hypothetical protein
MIGVIIAAGLAADVEWRRLALLVFALTLPIPAAILVGLHWWRARPGVSLRAARFCDAISAELRAGQSLRAALQKAAISVDADTTAELCRLGAPLAAIAASARSEFEEIGEELKALIARPGGTGVSPAALFDELGNLALAQVEVAHEVATAAAPAKATGVVLLIVPIAAIVTTASRNGFDPYLAQTAQRAAALLGAGLAFTGLVVTALILKRAK